MFGSSKIPFPKPQCASNPDRIPSHKIPLKTNSGFNSTVFPLQHHNRPVHKRRVHVKTRGSHPRSRTHITLHRRKQNSNKPAGRHSSAAGHKTIIAGRATRLRPIRGPDFAGSRARLLSLTLMIRDPFLTINGVEEEKRRITTRSADVLHVAEELNDTGARGPDFFFLSEERSSDRNGFVVVVA